MSWSALAPSLKALVDADTGAGGLNETSGSNKVTATYYMEAPVTATMPFLILSPIDMPEDKSFANDIYTASIQVSAWVNKYEQAQTGANIQNQVRTVFDRVAPSPTGWTATKCIVTNQRVFVEDEAFQYVTEFDVTLQKD